MAAATINEMCAGKGMAVSPAGEEEQDQCLERFLASDENGYNLTKWMIDVSDIIGQENKVQAGLTSALMDYTTGDLCTVEYILTDAQTKVPFNPMAEHPSGGLMIRRKDSVIPAGVEIALTSDRGARLYKGSVLFGRSGVMYTFAPKFTHSERRLIMPFLGNIHNLSLKDNVCRDIRYFTVRPGSTTRLCVGSVRDIDGASFNNDLMRPRSNLEHCPGFDIPVTSDPDTLIAHCNTRLYSRFIPVFTPELLGRTDISGGRLNERLIQDIDIHDMLLNNFPYTIDKDDYFITPMLKLFLDRMERFKGEGRNEIIEAVKTFVRTADKASYTEGEAPGWFERTRILSESPYPGEASNIMFGVYTDILALAAANIVKRRSM